MNKLLIEISTEHTKKPKKKPNVQIQMTRTIHTMPWKLLHLQGTTNLYDNHDPSWIASHLFSSEFVVIVVVVVGAILIFHLRIFLLFFRVFIRAFIRVQLSLNWMRL